MVDRHIHCCPWSHIYTHRKTRRIVIWLQSVPIVEAYTWAQIMETTCAAKTDRKKEQKIAQSPMEKENIFGDRYMASAEKRSVPTTQNAAL